MLFHCDNSATAAWLSCGAPHTVAARELVQRRFGLFVAGHIRLGVQHIPGASNVLADALSRGQWGRFGPECAAVLEVASPFLCDVLLQYELYWVRFLLVFGLVWFVVQPTEAVLSLYVAFLWAAYPTVKNYLQGLQRSLLDRGWFGHFSQWRGLQQALAGLRHRAKEVQHKLPITPFILLHVVQVLNFSVATEVMVFIAMLVAFGAFLRKANVCAASCSLVHVQCSLLRKDVVLDMRRYCLHVTLRFTHSLGSPPHTVVMSGMEGHPLDPVKWWADYVAAVPAPSEAAAFWVHVRWGVCAMMYTELVRWVKVLLSRAGFDASKYTGHSFRRGTASYSFLVGLPELLVKELGAWRSQVYQVYTWTLFQA